LQKRAGDDHTRHLLPDLDPRYQLHTINRVAETRRAALVNPEPRRDNDFAVAVHSGKASSTTASMTGRLQC